MLSIVVADWKGVVMDEHDLPLSAAVRRADAKQHVFFQGPGAEVYLNVSLEELMQTNAAVFFEFKHYKPKKKKISTRCWAFFTLGEVDLRSGATQRLALELYSKPTDLKCKKLSLHTKKELYAHLDVIVQTE